MELPHDFIFLDGPAERRQMTRRVRELRTQVLCAAAAQPSPHQQRNLLAHLLLTDVGAMWLLEGAQAGRQMRISCGMAKHAEQTARWLMCHRKTTGLARDIRHMEQRVCDFVMKVSLDRLSGDLHLPSGDAPLTVEMGIHHYFVAHWDEHLAQLRFKTGVLPQ